MLYRHKKTDYTSPAAAQGGPGIQGSVSWYLSTPYLNMTAAVWKTVAEGTGLSLGDIWTLGGSAGAAGGNAFMFVRYTEVDAGLTLGQLVTPDVPITGTCTVPGVPVTTTAAITTNVNESTSVANAEVNHWFYANVTAATLPQLRRVKANTNAATANFTVAQYDWMRPNSPYDADVLDTTPTNADPMTIIDPYHVTTNTATTTPIGVALGTVASGNYTIIQVYGLALVQAVGNGVGTGLVVNRPAVGGAAGVISGSAASAASLYTSASLILPQFATTAAALTIPCFVNFTAQ